jgi:hypothetical protein
MQPTHPFAAWYPTILGRNIHRYIDEDIKFEAEDMAEDHEEATTNTQAAIHDLCLWSTYGWF